LLGGERFQGVCLGGVLLLDRQGMISTMPRFWPSSRFDFVRSPPSQMIPRGEISGPISSKILNCLVSSASLPAKWKFNERPL
jgi:hypothetical protein